MATSTACAARGMPDWQSVFRTEQFDLLGAYDDPGLCFAVPSEARLAQKADGTPDLLLEFVSDQNMPGADDCQYAMLTMGLETDADLRPARAALQAAGSKAALLPCSFTSSCHLHLELGDTRVSAPFAWQDANRATIHARLAPHAARLCYGALASGALMVAGAAIECDVAAVLPRLDLQVRFEPGAVVAALRQALAPDGEGLPFLALINYLSAPPAGLFGFSAPIGGASPQLGLALAARLRAVFGSYLPCAQIANGPSIRLDAPTAAAGISWDLRTPMLAAVPRLLRYDPFGTAADSGLRDRVTVFTRVPRWPDQLRTRSVTLASGLPDKLGNCEQITVNLQVAASDAASGTATTYTHDVYPPEGQQARIDLAFAHVAPVQPYSVSLTVVSDDDAIDGDWCDASESYLFIDGGSLPPPLRIVTISAAPALLAEAAIGIAFSGVTSGPATASLGNDSPSASFLVAATGTARLHILATDKRGTANPIALDLPCHSVALDQTAFGSYGLQTVAVEARFHAGSSSARLEFLPEGENAESIVLDFSAITPSTQLRYVAHGMFRNGYRFRPYDDSGAAPAPWSACLAPVAVLTVGIHPDGVRAEEASTLPGELGP